MAAHLQVPLPYLLYRARIRYEEDLRGLQDVKSTLGAACEVSLANNSPPPVLPNPQSIQSTAPPGTTSRLTHSIRVSTLHGLHNRLQSSGRSSALSKRLSSSTMTVQGPKRRPLRAPSPPPLSAAGSSSSDGEDDQVEEEEKIINDQRALDRKLRHLQAALTSEALGLVRRPTSPERKGEEPLRGRTALAHSRLSSRGQEHPPSSTSGSLSATTSPQGSIPSISSPSADSHPRSPASRRLSPTKSISPPSLSLSPGRGRAQPQLRYSPLVARDASEGSNHGSSTSSFSDLSGKYLFLDT